MNVPAPIAPLVDQFGRVHNNLRISVTDRCNIRCFYCMPADKVQFLPRKDLLTFEEISRFVAVMAPFGVNKLRLTGGEPLVRNDLPTLVAMLVAIPGIEDISLTTNGILLAEQAQALYDAGLRRLNVSLDALDPQKFHEITRREGYEQVLAGIEAARNVGFDPIKINAVSIRGMTESEIVPFGHFARESGCEVRFIEYMPLDADNRWERDKVLFASEIIDVLRREIGPLNPMGTQSPHAPATDYEFADGRGKIGVIPSVSQPFCDQCNRFRLTADGKLRNCLFSLDETDIKQLLRSDAGDSVIEQTVRDSLAQKWVGHQINSADFVQPGRPMHSIGG
ncbi:MAG: GTP 3',8-cyclase MoaA [Planctomycetaceae bacterium]|nr:GTP 3',8-cyclase MoaA [Planctomycetaceae bacterium]